MTPLETVSVLDSSIDVSATGRLPLLEFAKSRDMRTLKFRAGQHPTVYVLREIPLSRYLDFVASGINDDDKRRRAFMSAVVEVRNLKIRGRSESVPVWKPSGVVPGDEGSLSVMAESDLEAFYPATIFEIGEVANTRSFLPPSSVPWFTLPPSLVSAVDRVLKSSAPTPDED